ncbi:MAG: efflux RND transporter periplasmic adaptor subunit [Planctomycetota bacterium]|nr:MAG: efflux RND transporter periplasmic adaptor subunit [Planctomycetota bacterium]
MKNYRTIPTQRPVLVLVLFLASTHTLACGPTALAAEAQSPAEADDLPQVVTIPVVDEDLTFSVTMPGSVRALESAALYAKVAGYLDRIDVDLGDEVVEGQVLAVLDIPEMQFELRRDEAEVAYARSRVEQQAAAVAQAEAAVGSAEAGLARLEQMHRVREADAALRRTELERWEHLFADSPAIEKRKVDEARYRLEAAMAELDVVDADMDLSRSLIEEKRAAVRGAGADEGAARARVAVAEADVELTRELMSYATIKAPFAGIITERHVDPGAFIMPAATNSAALPLLRVERIDRVRIAIDVPMDGVAALNTGDRAVFDRIAAAPGLRLEGTVTRISKALGERSKMMRAEIEFDNPVGPSGERALRPGYYGDLTVFLEELPGTPTVPVSAVFTYEGEMSVYAVQSGTIRRHAIEAVFQDGIRVGISSGLTTGQVVVTSGLEGLEDGQRVRVATEAGGDH